MMFNHMEIGDEMHCFEHDDLYVEVHWENTKPQILPENEMPKIENYQVFVWERTPQHIHVDAINREIINREHPDIDISINWTYKLKKYYDSRLRKWVLE